MCYIKQIDKLKKINSNVIKKTALEYNSRLSSKYKCNIFLKREDQNIVRSFKIRGAYNKIFNLNKYEKKKGIVCASAGNHAQGVAYCANLLNIDAKIFVPKNTPYQKINSILKFSKNNNLIIKGNNFDECLSYAVDYSLKKDNIFIHPFGDKDVINGQATICSEIYENINPDLIIGCIGGGGLMSGISLYSKKINKNCKIIGIEGENCNSMQKSILNNKIIELSNCDKFIDGAAVKKVSPITFNICKNNLDNIFTVSNNHLSYMILDLYQNDGIITEPAGALGITGFDLIYKDFKNKNVVIIISGANNDINRYPEMNELALQYKNLKHYFIIKFSQNPGELKKFVNNVLSENDDITRFEYLKKNNKNYGQVLIGIELSCYSNLLKIINKLDKYYEYKYINKDEVLMSYLV